jgi:hypothetical protein
MDKNIKAFPCDEIVDADYNGHNNSKDIVKHTGMDLRDYFAAKALSGLLSNPRVQEKDDAWSDYNEMANWAYSLADAMLEERLKHD